MKFPAEENNYQQISECENTCLGASPTKNQTFIILGLIIFTGFLLRLWGTSNFGLHGDEETTAMAALSILEDGSPRCPSGMLYLRAILHSYFIAFSVMILGHEEWALRLPSVLAGTLEIGFVYFLGKRFLPYWWNLLLVIAVALNPDLIQYSQTARMYIFFSASLVLFTVMIFKWERTGRIKDLLTAFFCFIIALQFQSLTIFSAFLFFFPYITSPSKKRLYHSLVAFSLAGIAFKVNSFFISAQYNSAKLSPAFVKSVTKQMTFPYLMVDHILILGLLALLCIIVLLWFARLRRYNGISWYISMGREKGTGE